MRRIHKIDKDFKKSKKKIARETDDEIRRVDYQTLMSQNQFIGSSSKKYLI